MNTLMELINKKLEEKNPNPKYKNYTQMDIAVLLGVETSVVNGFLKGRRKLSPKKQNEYLNILQNK